MTPSDGLKVAAVRGPQSQGRHGEEDTRSATAPEGKKMGAGRRAIGNHTPQA